MTSWTGHHFNPPLCTVEHIDIIPRISIIRHSSCPPLHTVYSPYTKYGRLFGFNEIRDHWYKLILFPTTFIYGAEPCCLKWARIMLRTITYFVCNPSCDMGSRDTTPILDKLCDPCYDLVEIPKDDNSIHHQKWKISEYVNSNLQEHVCNIYYVSSILWITIVQKPRHIE